MFFNSGKLSYFFLSLHDVLLNLKIKTNLSKQQYVYISKMKKKKNSLKLTLANFFKIRSCKQNKLYLQWAIQLTQSAKERFCYINSQTAISSFVQFEII